jgi:glycosyltransferase involved in cell wall biosynthesis
MADVYREADLLVIPSLSEGGPRVLLEGMTAGIPVISTPVGLVPDLLDQRMIVNGVDEATWARALPSVMSNGDLLSEASMANLRLVNGIDWPARRRRRKALFDEVIQATGDCS